MKIRLEPIIPKGEMFHTAQYNKAVERAGGMSAKAIEVDFHVTTRTWTHQPAFKIVHITGNKEWEIFTEDPIYGYVSLGTKPHDITPKNARRLVFYRTGFRPKSRAGWIGSNKGKKATKDLTFAKKVHHPGTAARKFAPTIKEKWEVEWPRQLARAIRSVSQYG